MLSRVANSLYWLSRYLERAENLARLVEVNRYESLDSIDPDPWRPLLYTTCNEKYLGNQRSKMWACLFRSRRIIQIRSVSASHTQGKMLEWFGIKFLKKFGVI